jgi:SAM-dependent methyltransferase
MRWKHKASIMKFCAHSPGGQRLYSYLQKTFGRLRADPMSRLPTQAEMVKWIREAEQDIVGSRILEVGTGHVPVVPIGFFLCGARSVVTVDLHRRIEWGLTRKSLEWMAAHRDGVFGIYRDWVDERLFDERFAVLSRCQHDPSAFFREADIDYLAPMDAAYTRLQENSIDYHISITVMEHIPFPVIRDIFLEAKRIVKPTGAVIHFVDMSDHFQHTDHSITSINFLQYSGAEWQRIAGNEFAYCNRLRTSDYLKMFDELGYVFDRQETVLDEESMTALEEGKVDVDPIFSGYGPVDLCTTSLRVCLGMTK